jgi:crossover junction endodeoxyribonuclease RuvC
MTKRQSYRVVGIDPGLNVTGYAVVDFAARRLEPAIVEAGAIRTGAKGGLPARIQQLHADMAEILAELKPNLAAIEKLYAHYKHPRTSILMAHARGALLLACRQAGLKIMDLEATRIKKSLTGNGRASKLQIQRAIQALCKLKDLPSPPDVADALAIALCAGRDQMRPY